MRAAFVGYKDLGEDQHLVTCPFLSHYDRLFKVLEGLHAKGGGEYPEDVAGALKAVIELDWASDYKVLLLFLICTSAWFRISRFTGRG